MFIQYGEYRYNATHVGKYNADESTLTIEVEFMGGRKLKMEFTDSSEFQSALDSLGGTGGAVSTTAAKSTTPVSYSTGSPSAEGVLRLTDVINASMDATQGVAVSPKAVSMLGQELDEMGDEMREKLSELRSLLVSLEISPDYSKAETVWQVGELSRRFPSAGWLVGHFGAATQGSVKLLLNGVPVAYSQKSASFAFFGNVQLLVREGDQLSFEMDGVKSASDIAGELTFVPIKSSLGE